ncbi:MAG: efflux RND transporter periplasmic adaptor subunit [Archangium gephyra]|uniref:Efflux RND transporter periplasmic adaptor subunit n=1 Tax=Archangium gephyra TaxID=48 RepID=A0A2W5UTS0_9BACT|nr:MAG: efflux RND transporter periplasmic adaptor subunit [Archangium gephyra]
MSEPSSRDKPVAEDDLGFELPPPTKVSSKRGVFIVGAAIAALVVLFLVGFLPKLLGRHELEKEFSAEAGALPRVEVIQPKVLSSDRAMVLPGTAQPLEDTVLYPRVAGYVKKWNVDLGDDVKEGDVLMEIDTPELDAQLEQGRAQLAEAEASVIRAKSAVSVSTTMAERYKTLAPAGIASQQDFEQRQGQADVDAASVGVATANVAAAQANLRRLQQTKGFTKVVAPFSGRVVQRFVERGMLVNAGTTNPLYRIQNTDPIRVFINVPQDVAPSVKTGAQAVVTVREFAGKEFRGQVSRSAGSLDEVSRTMTTEVRVPNPEHELLSGMYVQVALNLPVPHRLLEVPATALYTDSKGTRVAVVDAQNTVSMRKVVIERDMGSALQISTGLNGDERVVKLASSALDDGTKVEIIQPAAPKVEPAK